MTDETKRALLPFCYKHGIQDLGYSPTSVLKTCFCSVPIDIFPETVKLLHYVIDLSTGLKWIDSEEKMLLFLDINKSVLSSNYQQLNKLEMYIQDKLITERVVKKILSMTDNSYPYCNFFRRGGVIAVLKKMILKGEENE